MTKPRTNAWTACPRCGRRKLVSTPGLCGPCNRNRSDESMSSKMMRVAVFDARKRGHDMADPVRDFGPREEPSEKDGYITFCRKCDGYIVVDLDEARNPYGRATEGRCAGRPPVRQAARREVSLERPSFQYPPPLLGWTQAETLWVAKMVPGDFE